MRVKLISADDIITAKYVGLTGTISHYKGGKAFIRLDPGQPFGLNRITGREVVWVKPRHFEEV